MTKSLFKVDTTVTNCGLMAFLLWNSMLKNSIEGEKFSREEQSIKYHSRTFFEMILIIGQVQMYTTKRNQGKRMGWQ